LIDVKCAGAVKVDSSRSSRDHGTPNVARDISGPFATPPDLAVAKCSRKLFWMPTALVA